MTVIRIISGGQTGADRGALDAAMKLGLKWGGYAPLCWGAEDGAIPLLYRKGMIQSGSSDYRVRTRANIEASDGTLILSIGHLSVISGGSYLTAKMARTLCKPCRHFTVAVGSMGLDIARAWIAEHSIRTLNVAGPRESREPGVRAAVCAALVAVLGPESPADPWDP